MVMYIYAGDPGLNGGGCFTPLALYHFSLKKQNFAFDCVRVLFCKNPVSRITVITR